MLPGVPESRRDTGPASEGSAGQGGAGTTMLRTISRTSFQASHALLKSALAMLPAWLPAALFSELLALLTMIVPDSALAPALHAQDAHMGLAVPLTFSGQLVHTERALAIEADTATWRPSFRALASPSLKLGDHWYAYSALQISAGPYSFYKTYYSETEFETRWLQGFVGYRVERENQSIN